MKEVSEFVIGLSLDDEFIVKTGYKQTHIRTTRDDVIELITSRIIDYYPTAEELSEYEEDGS